MSTRLLIICFILFSSPDLGAMTAQQHQLVDKVFQPFPALKTKLLPGLAKGFFGFGLKDKKIEFTPQEIEDLKASFVPALDQFTWLSKVNLDRLATLEALEKLSALPNLDVLTLNHNQLTTIPDSVLSLTKLNILHVGHNKIKKIPHDFGRLSNLMHLSLVDNQIEMVGYQLKPMIKKTIIDLQLNPVKGLFPGFECPRANQARILFDFKDSEVPKKILNYQQYYEGELKKVLTPQQVERINIQLDEKIISLNSIEDPDVQFKVLEILCEAFVDIEALSLSNVKKIPPIIKNLTMLNFFQCTGPIEDVDPSLFEMPTLTNIHLTFASDDDFKKSSPHMLKYFTKNKPGWHGKLNLTFPSRETQQLSGLDILYQVDPTLRLVVFQQLALGVIDPEAITDPVSKQQYITYLQQNIAAILAGAAVHELCLSGCTIAQDLESKTLKKLRLKNCTFLDQHKHHFPALNAIEAENCTHIDKHVFALAKTTELSFVRCKLTSGSLGFVRNCYEPAKIDLRGNYIITIPNHWSGNKIKTIDLRDNNIFALLQEIPAFILQKIQITPDGLQTLSPVHYPYAKNILKLSDERIAELEMDERRRIVIALLKGANSHIKNILYPAMVTEHFVLADVLKDQTEADAGAIKTFLCENSDLFWKLVWLKKLDLRNLGLQQVSLRCMNRLEDVDLSDNPIGSFVCFSARNSLKSLKLARCNLIEFASAIVCVADWALNAPNLQVLDLSENNLTEIIALSINVGKDRPSLPVLRELSLRSNKLKEIPSVLQQMPALERFDFRGHDIAELPEFLTELPKLTEVKISGARLKQMPGTLKTFAVDIAKLDPDHVDKLIEKGRRDDIVKALLLQADDDTKKAMTDNLVEGKFLIPDEWLEIYSSQKSVWVASHLKEIFEACPWLYSVNLRYSNLKKLPVALSSLTSLKELKLSFNNFSSVSEELKNLTQLVTLNIEHNPVVTLPLWLKECPNLKLLISVDTLQELHPELEAWAKTNTNLKLDDIINLIDQYKFREKYGDRIKVVDELLKTADDVVKKELRLNLIQGEFFFPSNWHMNSPQTPEDITKNKRLEWISTHMKEIFTKCTWLTTVNVNGANLGKLPDAIFDLKSLVFLEVQRNNLSAFPDGAKKLAQLRFLRINQNPMITLPLWVKDRPGLQVEFSKDDIQELHPDLETYAIEKLNFVPKLVSEWVDNYRFSEQHRARANAVDAMLAGQPVEVLKVIRLPLIHGYLGFAPSGIENHGPCITGTGSEPKVIDYVTKNLGTIFKTCTWLTHVHLSGLPKLTKLPDEVEKLTQLEVLNLSWVGIDTLPVCLAKIATLKKMSVKDDILKTLPPELRGIALNLMQFPAPKVDKLIAQYVVEAELAARPAKVDALLASFPVAMRAWLRERILDGRFGFHNDERTLSTYSDEVKENIKRVLPQLLSTCTWLTHVNLSGMKLTELPAEVAALTHCVHLDLSSNFLTDLPQEFEKLSSLKILALDYNKFTRFPDIVTRLPALEKLRLGHNFLTSLPESIGQLTHLISLGLKANLLRDLPDALFSLPELWKLTLSKNQLTQFQRKPVNIAGPASPLMYPRLNLPKLLELDLSHNQLMTCPKIGQLTALRKLNLSGNYLHYMDFGLFSCQHLKQLNLDSNPLMGEDSTEKGMGFVALKHNLGDFVTFDHTRKIINYPTENEVYEYLDREIYSWNRIKLAELKPLLVPDLGLTGPQVLELLPKIWAGFDFENEKLPDGRQNPLYFSCACLGYQISPTHSNLSLLHNLVLPLMRGYVKELYGIEHNDDEPVGHQPLPDQVEATKRSIAYIWHELSQMPPEDRVHYIIQYYIGIKECVVGQKGALDTVATNLMLRHKKGEVENTEGLAYFIKTNFIAAKEQAFVASVNLAQNNPNSVHLVDHYRAALGSRLGLSDQLSLARDPYDQVTNIDPHEGNLAHALQQFYADFTPQDFVERIVGLVETAEDRLLKKRAMLTQNPELMAQAKAIKVMRPLTVNSFMVYMLDNRLITNADFDKDEGEWRAYFTANPRDEAEIAQIYPALVMRILVHMGLVVESYDYAVFTY